MAARGYACANHGAAHRRRTADAGQRRDLADAQATRSDSGGTGRKLRARHGLGAAVRVGSDFCGMDRWPGPWLNAADNAVEMMVMHRPGDWWRGHVRGARIISH